jgi:hypothetical protein
MHEDRAMDHIKMYCQFPSRILRNYEVVSRCHPRQTVVHIREVDYFVLPRLGVDFTHVNDQRTKLKMISTLFPALVIIPEFIH